MEQIGMIGRPLLLLFFCFWAADAFGQTAKELVGSWTLISITVNRDGEKTEPFGSNPKGTMTFDSGGRFSIIVTRSDLPKFAFPKGCERPAPLEERWQFQAGSPYKEQPPADRAIVECMLRPGTRTLKRSLLGSPKLFVIGKLVEGLVIFCWIKERQQKLKSRIHNSRCVPNIKINRI